MTNFHFYGGAALSPTHFVTIAYDLDRDRPSEPFPFTRIQVLNAAAGTWLSPVFKDWRAESVAASSSEYSVLSANGDVYVSSLGMFAGQDEVVSTTPTLGMYGLGYVNNTLHAVGAGGHLYRRKEINVWERYETEQYYAASALAKEEEEISDLPFGDPRLMARLDAQVARLRPWYCVTDDCNGGFWIGGQNGQLVHFFNGQQQNLILPTSANFSEVVNGPDGQMFAIAHTPRAEIWRLAPGQIAELIFTASRTEHAPYRAATLGDVLYFGDPESATGGLFQLDGNGAVRATILGSAQIADVFQVREVQETLWVVEATCVWRMSDGQWQRFERPLP